MSKIQKSKTEGQKPGKKNADKQSKLPEVEDFFTNYIAKKVRNLKKKLEHISDLEKKSKQGEELKKEQLDSVSKRSETEEAIVELNKMKTSYLEAYSKKGDEEVVNNLPAKKSEVIEENVVEKVEVPQFSQAEIEEKAVEKTLESVSKLVTVALLLNTEDKCKQFHEKSGKIFNLNSLEEVANSLNDSNVTNNWDKHISLKNSLKNYVNKEQLNFSVNLKTFNALNEFVTNVISSESFGEFVPAEPKVFLAPYQLKYQ